MKTTTNYKLKQPEGSDTVNIDDLNYNTDIIDIELKKANDKANNISVPVKSVNNKTGYVLLKADDIKCNDGNSIESHMDDVTKQIDGIEVTAEKTKLNNPNFRSTNVNGALNELFQNASNNKQKLADIITGLGGIADVSMTNSQLYEEVKFLTTTNKTDDDIFLYNRLFRYKGADVPFAQTGQGVMQACTDGNNIYMVVQGTLYKYSPSTNIWIGLESKYYFHAKSVACCYYSGNIYFGGNIEFGSVQGGNDIKKYNISSGTTTTLMNYSRGIGYYATGYNNKIYFCTSYDSKNFTIYDIASNTISQSSSSLSTNRKFPSRGMYYSSIYVFCGDDNSDISVYNTSTNAWTTLTCEIGSITTTNICVYDNRYAFLIGLGSDFRDIKMYDFASNKIYTLNTKLPFPSVFGVASIVNDKLFVFGGYTDYNHNEKNSSSNVFIFNFKEDLIFRKKMKGLI